MIRQKEKNDFIMKRIVNGWNTRAKIHHDSIQINFDKNKDDFIESLLPFYKHPKYQELDHQQKQNCLSCGWIIYNEKTLMIESEIVNPACKYIIDGHIPGLKTNEARLAACETMIDESYHMLLVEQANQITKINRGLQHIKYTPFHLSKSIKQSLNNCTEAWMEPLLQLAIATVTEVLISDYLSKLASCDTIQPMNKLTVATHLHDELAHSKLFSTMLNQFYYKLDAKQKSFFAKALKNGLMWFKNNELDLWKSVLDQLRVKNSREIIEDLRASNLTSIAIDCADLIAVLKSNGILEDKYNCDLFADLGTL